MIRSKKRKEEPWKERKLRNRGKNRLIFSKDVVVYFVCKFMKESFLCIYMDEVDLEQNFDNYLLYKKRLDLFFETREEKFLINFFCFSKMRMRKSFI